MNMGSLAFLDKRRVLTWRGSLLIVFEELCWQNRISWQALGLQSIVSSGIQRNNMFGALIKGIRLLATLVLVAQIL